VYARLNYLKKNYPVFSSTDVSYSLGATMGRSIVWRSAGMNAFVVGNFGTIAITVTATLPKAGTWYNGITGESETIPSTAYSVALAPGEFRLYIDQIVSAIEKNTTSAAESPIVFFDNKIWYKGSEKANIRILDLTGKLIFENIISTYLDLAYLQKGIYLVLVNENGKQYSSKLMKN
jgi:hypothetical protein